MPPSKIGYKLLKRAISHNDVEAFNKYLSAATGELPSGVTKTALEKAVEKDRRDFIYRLASIEAPLCKNELDVMDICYPILLATAAQSNDTAQLRKWSFLRGRNGRKESALMQAARMGCREAFDYLLPLERASICGSDNTTALMAAVEGDNTDFVRKILIEEPETDKLAGR